MTEKRSTVTPLTPRGLRALRKNGKLLFKEAEKLRSKYLTTLSDRDALLLDAAMQRVQGLLNQPELKVKDIPALEESQEALDGLLNTLLGSKRKSAFREYVESIVYAVAIALLIRTAVVEPFKIPTGSMIPTLEINDHIFVSKFSYGVRIPFSGGVRIGSGNPIERGDIIVFENPEAGEDEGKDFIKRVVGIEGDTVRMENNHLWVNGEQVPTEILEDNPCDDGSGRNCGFQEETGAKGPYKTQHVIPTAYRTVEGDTLEIIGKRIGVQPENLVTLNRHRLDAKTLALPNVTSEKLPAGTALQIRSPKRWNFGNSPQWPLPAAACSGNTSLRPCFGSENDSNPDYPAVRVPEDHVLVFGDNRDNSRDGRFWGFVPRSHIKGRAFIIWYAERSERIFTSL